MTTIQNKTLGFRRCWINKTNNFKSNFASPAYSILNISDCPLVTAASGYIGGAYNNGVLGVTFTTMASDYTTPAKHPYSNGQQITIANTTNYNGTWTVSLCTDYTFNVLDVACPYWSSQTGIWAGSWDVSNTGDRVKITIENSMLKDIDLSQSYLAELSNINDCKMSGVTIGSAKLINCEEITGSPYFAITGGAMLDSTIVLNLSLTSGTVLMALGSGFSSNIDLEGMADNIVNLENCIISGDIIFESNTNMTIKLANSNIINSGSITSISKGALASSSVELKGTTVDGGLTMVAGTILKKYNSQVIGKTFIDNGVDVTYGIAERALKAVQIIMTGN